MKVFTVIGLVASLTTLVAETWLFCSALEQGQPLEATWALAVIVLMCYCVALNIVMLIRRWQARRRLRAVQRLLERINDGSVTWDELVRAFDAPAWTEPPAGWRGDV